jgi:hypothetical protein
MLFGAWCSQVDALLSVCVEIMTRSVVVWPQCTIVTDGRTDDWAPSMPIHWLASRESAKMFTMADLVQVRYDL